LRALFLGVRVHDARAGIPARVVTGYQGGELNPVDQIISVRQSDAHAWAEVFLKGRGWVRVDPTAAACRAASVRPGARAARGRAAAADAAAAARMAAQHALPVGRARAQWNVWVLGYNPSASAT